MNREPHKDYDELLELVAIAIQSQEGVLIECGREWRNDGQILALKFFKHLVSAGSLAQGVVYSSSRIGKSSFVDHSSMNVLIRAALESYLTLWFIFCQRKESVCRFRHLTWKLGGLLDRQAMWATTDENKNKLKDEHDQLDALKSELTLTDEFKVMSAKSQKDTLKGKWRGDNSWSDIAVKAGFHGTYFRMTYSYLCGYSHASYASALQVGQAAPETQLELGRSILGLGSVVMAHFIQAYQVLFPAATEVLVKARGFDVAAKWYFSAEDMDSIYGSQS